MIDLDELEKKFEELFQTETAESFDIWLEEKRDKANCNEESKTSSPT